MKFKKFSKEKPVGNKNWDIPVLCKVHGLSMNASEYEEYVVLKWRESIKCFIEWKDGKNGIESHTYSGLEGENSNYGFRTVTEWCYLPSL